MKVVSLRSHDFTGLGFNVNGNMRDGIYIKDVLQKGPASASGKLNPGTSTKETNKYIQNKSINFFTIIFHLQAIELVQLL